MPASPISLAALTVLELDPPDMVICASAVGYDLVGIRLIPSTDEEPHHDSIGITPLIKETRARSADFGIPVLDVETLRLGDRTNVKAFEPFLETGAYLGARNIVVAGLDHDLTRLADNLAELAELADAFRLTPNLEFMPWTAARDLATAVSVIEAAAHPNIGLLVDSLHFDRSDSDPQALSEIPRERLRYLQICDGPAARPETDEELVFAARHDRLMPGDGDIDLQAQLKVVPRGIPISAEVPLLAGLTVPAAVRAGRVLAHTRAVLESLATS